jgi:hypothetical protein
VFSRFGGATPFFFSAGGLAALTFSVETDTRMAVSDDEIWATIKAHVERNPGCTDSVRSENISALELFISKQERYISAMEARSVAPVTFESKDLIFHRVVPLISQIRCFVSEINAKIYAIQLKHFRRTIFIARQIRDYVCNTPETMGNCQRLDGVARDAIKRDPAYRRLRLERRLLMSKAQSTINRNLRRDPLCHLQSEVLVAIDHYDDDVSYSRPCGFDVYLEDYIRYNPELSVLVLPAAAVVAEGTPMALLSTLSEFNLAVMNCLKISSGPARAVVYTSLVRFLFAVGYTLSPAQLDGRSEENFAFLNACEKFSEQTVRDLVFAKVITQDYTPGLKVASLFKSKQVEKLKPMESMSNPIDLMYFVHEILGTLATHFASQERFLAFDDTLTLLLALMSLCPPVNAVAIAAFVTKWDSVQLSSVVSIAKNYFVAAVGQILMHGRTQSS